MFRSHRTWTNSVDRTSRNNNNRIKSNGGRSRELAKINNRNENNTKPTDDDQRLHGGGEWRDEGGDRYLTDRLIYYALFGFCFPNNYAALIGLREVEGNYNNNNKNNDNCRPWTREKERRILSLRCIEFPTRLNSPLFSKDAAFPVSHHSVVSCLGRPPG